MSARAKGEGSEVVPELRLRPCNAAELRPAGEFVLYWMIAARRASWSFALDRAVELSRALAKPLVVLEPLRAAYPFASDRLHRFVLQGMRDNAASFSKSGVLHHPYVEPAPGAGKGLVEALGARAAAVVTDDFPCSFLPRMVAAAARRLRVRLEAVDSNGLLPLRAAERAFPTAHGFRSFLQRELPAHLEARPRAKPFQGRALEPMRALPAEIRMRWPAAPPALLAGEARELAKLPIDHAVAPVATAGGTRAATAALRTFLDQHLARYAEERNHPDAGVTSQLSPYLHFGHISAHQVLAELAEREGWSPGEAGGAMAGKREGWWGTSASAEAFLDQLVTWRELGFNRSALTDDYDRYAGQPDWARATLAKHARDRRPKLYAEEQLESASTADELWNAAQRELLQEGRIHNYLRMLWGKKILEWSPTPELAFERMVRMNDRFALDGRDPNSYSGIGWVLGRYDRPWGPERPIYGTVRYMTSASTARKLRMKAYLARYGSGASSLFP